MINECSTWPVSANLSYSNREGRAKALLHSAPESTPSSLKFTTRLLTESTWQACAQENSQPHTTSCCCLNQGDWKATVCAFLIREARAVLICGCIHFSQFSSDAAGWESLERAELKREHQLDDVACHVSICLLICVS